MRLYAVCEYHQSQDGSMRVNGDVKSVLEADNYFEAMEKSGFNDPDKYVVEEIHDIQRFRKEFLKSKEEMLKVEKQIEGVYNKCKEESKVCPNCENKLNEKGRCDECGFGKESDLGITQKMEEIKKDFQDRVNAGTMSQAQYDQEVEDMEKTLTGIAGMTKEDMDKAVQDLQKTIRVNKKKAKGKKK